MINKNKILLVIFIAMLIPLSALANPDEKFYKALQTCTPYIANGIVDVKDVIADYKSQIFGWENDKCVFRKYVNLMGIQICTTCRFSQPQIDEIVSVMQRYKTGQSITGEDVDVYDIETMKKTPVIRVWNKYIEDPNVCNIGL